MAKHSDTLAVRRRHRGGDGAPLAGARIIRPDVNTDRHAAALQAWGVIGPLAAVFMTFSLVQSMSEYRRAEAAVAHEATSILQLDRVLAILADADGTPARRDLRRYLQTVISDEWPRARNGAGESIAANNAFSELQASLERLMQGGVSNVQSRAELIKNLDDVQDDRSARVGAAQVLVPPVMWWVTSLLFALIFMAAAGLKPSLPWILMAALYGSGLAMVAGCFYIVDGPFQGEFSVSPRPMIQAASSMEARLH